MSVRSCCSVFCSVLLMLLRTALSGCDVFLFLLLLLLLGRQDAMYLLLPQSKPAHMRACGSNVHLIHDFMLLPRCSSNMSVSW